jgi:GDP-L-fucose synthase
MKVFVPGHRGLVGSAVLRRKPTEIQVVTRERSELDLTDYKAMLQFFNEEKFDGFVLCAARVGGIGANSKHQRAFLTENLSIQNSVISAAADAGITNGIFLGSACIYPKITEQPIPETALLTGLLEPSNEGYALAKIAGLRLIKAISDEIGLNYKSLMPTNLYGPGDNFDVFSSHVAAALMRKFHEAKLRGSSTVSVWGSGTPRREFMHVDDMADACWYMLPAEGGGEIFNVGTGVDMTISEYAGLISKVVGFQGVIEYETEKLDGTPKRLLDVSKIHSKGWKHKIEIEWGLSRTYSWFEKAYSMGAIRGF